MLFFIVVAVGLCLSLVVCAKGNPEYTLLEKQLSAQQFILKYEGFLKKAKYDGNYKGRRLYSIGFGTRAKRGDTITKEEAGNKMNKYLISVVFSRLDPDLPINKYVAYASFAYNTGVIPKECEYILIEEYQYSRGKKLKGLEKRRHAEYNMCIGEPNE